MALDPHRSQHGARRDRRRGRCVSASITAFDYKAIAAAAARNATGKKRIRGGSTISQQTAKNVFLWQGGGYFRKAWRPSFTMLIENIWGKRRIMEVYLNVAETGIGTYGVNAGAMRYFKHDASQLSDREAAMIAAVLPLPGNAPRSTRGLHAALWQFDQPPDRRGAQATD